MTKRETFELLKKIKVFYDQFIVNQEKLNLWHEVLKDFPLEEIQENLFVYVTGSSFPPKVADLILKSESKQAVPSPNETKGIFTAGLGPASPEVVQRELTKMRDILGIMRR